MTDVHTLKDINKKSDSSHGNPGRRLGSAYEEELEKKLSSAIDFNSEITDFNEKLQTENSEYSKREKESQRNYADIGNKISRLNASSTKLRSQFTSERKSHSERQRELEAKHSAEIQSLKSVIKTLKRKATLAQKASSSDKTTILSLEAKICELEAEVERLEHASQDSNVVGGMLEEPTQINIPSEYDPKEIDSLRRELKWMKADLNYKKHEIECMEKGMETTNNIFKREIDTLYSARSNLMEENRSLKDQLVAKKDNKVVPPSSPMNDVLFSSSDIPVGGAEASSLMSPLVTYSLLTLLLIAIIWFIVKKIWNAQKKDDQHFSYEKYEDRPGIIPNYLPYEYWR